MNHPRELLLIKGGHEWFKFDQGGMVQVYGGLVHLR
jgi:hypothetical protein